MRRLTAITGVGLAVVVALAAVQTGGAAQAATAPTPTSSAKLTPFTFKPIPPGPKVLAVPDRSAANATGCPSTKAQLAPYAARGQHAVTCVRRVAATKKNAPRSSAGGSTSSGVKSNATLWCQGLGDNTWWATRDSLCITNEQVTVTVTDADTGAVLGTGDLALSQSIQLDTQGTVFGETDSVALTAATGVVAEVQVTLSGDCTGGSCAVANPFAFVDAPLTVGQSVSGDINYSDAPAPGPDLITTEYDFNVTVPGTTTVAEPAPWTDPTDLRCDALVGSNAGCVIPFVTPTVIFSISATGSTAVIDDWAETAENAAWGNEGSGSPLTRTTNQTLIDANRTAMCGDGTFVNLYPGDSCEEYPYASTLQSGGNNGLTGAQCAQVEAVYTNNQWFIATLSTVTGNEGCVRGHADVTSQNSQGGVLSSFYQQYRVLDGDDYWVAVGS